MVYTELLFTHSLFGLISTWNNRLSRYLPPTTHYLSSIHRSPANLRTEVQSLIISLFPVTLSATVNKDYGYPKAKFHP